MFEAKSGVHYIIKMRCCIRVHSIGLATRKAHKNRVFIINPLSATSIWCQGRILDHGQILGQGRNLGQGQILVHRQILGQSQILGQGQILGQDRGQGQCVCGCIWRSMSVCAKPDVSVDSADGARAV